MKYLTMVLLVLSTSMVNADTATAELFNTMQYQVLTCASTNSLNCDSVYSELRNGEKGVQYKCPPQPQGHVYDYANECRLVKVKPD